MIDPAASAEAISVVFGLGNPGRRHARNRHNIGCMVVDRLALSKNAEFVRGDGPFVYCRVSVDDTTLTLAKSTTYMNETGRAAGSLFAFSGLKPSHVLAVVDDCYLPLGKIRFRRRGSDGGHNGLASMIEHLGTCEFPRLRLGIGLNPPGVALEDYVLMNFSEAESGTVDRMIEAAVAFIPEIAGAGFARSSVTITVAEE